MHGNGSQTSGKVGAKYNESVPLLQPGSLEAVSSDGSKVVVGDGSVPPVRIRLELPNGPHRATHGGRTVDLSRVDASGIFHVYRAEDELSKIGHFRVRAEWVPRTLHDIQQATRFHKGRIVLHFYQL